MKKNIHPKYYLATIKDISSGKVFKIGSTISSLSVEISSNTHPFYTGNEKIIDTENRVETYVKKIEKTSKLKGKLQSKKLKEEKRKKSNVKKVEAGEVLTLRDMLKQIK